MNSAASLLFALGAVLVLLTASATAEVRVGETVVFDGMDFVGIPGG